MWAQRAHCDAVDSYEGEGTLMGLLIRGDELTLHESGIGVELIAGLQACIGVSSYVLRAPRHVSRDRRRRAIRSRFFR
jgi:hypothetical protein